MRRYDGSRGARVQDELDVLPLVVTEGHQALRLLLLDEHVQCKWPELPATLCGLGGLTILFAGRVRHVHGLASGHLDFAAGQIFVA